MNKVTHRNLGNFVGLIEKARLAYLNSGQLVTNHFDDVVKMVGIGSNALQPVEGQNRAFGNWSMESKSTLGGGDGRR